MTHRQKLTKLQQLFESHQYQLYVVAMAITHNRSSAEDAVHDALLAVAEVTTEPNNLKAYLFQTVRNKALHSKRTADRFEFETNDSGNVDEFFAFDQSPPERRALAVQVLRILKTLETDQQQVLIMKLFSGLTFEEIAHITDKPLNTVASWYRRGLQKLKEKVHVTQS